MNRIVISLLIGITLFSTNIISEDVFGQNENPEEMFNLAMMHFGKGEYKEAIIIYDEILEIAPNNISTLKMKGIAQSNLEYHEKSLMQFFKIY